VVEISQPLFPMGMKTPISILHLSPTVTADAQQLPCRVLRTAGSEFIWHQSLVADTCVILST
jgi:hypothetical protein